MFQYALSRYFESTNGRSRKKYKPDGLFYDLIDESPCYCKYCLADMKKKGLNPDDEADAKRHAVDVLGKYLHEINTLAKSLKPDILIFHNGGDFPVGRKDRTAYCDQLETESLPTGEVLADKISPYFKREWPKFCSHQHTPYDNTKRGVAIT